MKYFYKYLTTKDGFYNSFLWKSAYTYLQSENRFIIYKISNFSSLDLQLVPQMLDLEEDLPQPDHQELVEVELFAKENQQLELEPEL